MPRLFILALILCSACAPALDPNGGGAYYAALTTATVIARSAQATAQPVTQSYLESVYAQSLTATFIGPALTATENANVATRIANELSAQRATSEAFRSSAVISDALQAQQVLESDTQRTIADNNRAMAESQYRANAMQWVYYGGASAFVIFIFIFAIVAARQTQIFLDDIRTIQKGRAMFKAKLDSEREARRWGYYVTSGGFTEARALAAPIVEQRKANYSHEQLWRGAIRKLVTHGVIAGQGGAKHPFSETELSQFVTRPDTHKVWTDGYRKLSRVLQANEIWFCAGARVAPEWGQGWTWDRFESEFDTTPLHSLPDGNPPDVKTPAWSFGQVEV